VAGLVLTTALVAASALTQSSRCCPGQDPYISLYNRSLSHVESVLVHGDGQAFAAIAQDPLLARPAVIGSSGDYAYRAQRPLWAYLGWLASLGQPALVPWALAALTICSGGAATFVLALLLLRRRLNPWWALGALVVGVRALMGYTPELAALAFLGAGLLLWSDRRDRWAVVALCLAALTRESMLVGVAALAVWELAHQRGTGGSLRRVRALAWPFVAYGAWVAVVSLRLGVLPYGTSSGRLGLPGAGLTAALGHGTDPATVLAGAVTAGIVTLGAVAWARNDPLTWVAVGFAGFATLLGPEVWTTDGLVRTLLPLYALGVVAGAAGWRAHRQGRRRTASAATTGEPIVLGWLVRQP